MKPTDSRVLGHDPGTFPRKKGMEKLVLKIEKRAFDSFLPLLAKPRVELEVPGSFPFGKETLIQDLSSEQQLEGNEESGRNRKDHPHPFPKRRIDPHDSPRRVRLRPEKIIA
jgi:hypothetical protein